MHWISPTNTTIRRAKASTSTSLVSMHYGTLTIMQADFHLDTGIYIEHVRGFLPRLCGFRPNCRIGRLRWPRQMGCSIRWICPKGREWSRYPLRVWSSDNRFIPQHLTSGFFSSGIAVGERFGVAKKANVIAVKVLSDEGCVFLRLPCCRSLTLRT